MYLNFMISIFTWLDSGSSVPLPGSANQPDEEEQRSSRNERGHEDV